MTSPKIKKFRAHVEKFLGPVHSIWKDDETGMQAISIADCPFEGFSTYMSIGIANHAFENMFHGEPRRMEIIITVMSDVAEDLAKEFVLQISNLIVYKHKRILNGEIISLHTSWKEKLGFDQIYCTDPRYFDEKFFEFKESDPVTLIVWLFPLFGKEAEYIGQAGNQAFEDLLAKHDPDLWRWDRQPMI